ncbi:hypothetical protein E2I00_015272 [Balaenoptera physalus]|uniref:THAP-type domain-containing protein n=1 Tax=Balaenoptera physalus TaxID=9770 RepID=A0A643C337_BALPH|nr:hypothetical protein E2I00_015272 [Balaenoptera physalus]
MGREHWVPSCHQHLCSEHFAPSCFQWRWGVRYLRPDAVPSIFSRAPPAKLRAESLLAPAHRGRLRALPGPEESQAFTIICGGPDIAVVLAQGPAPPTLDAKPELLDTQTPSA